MGRIVAKALSCDRLFGLRWSHVFWKLLLACCNVILKNEKQTRRRMMDGILVVLAKSQVLCQIIWQRFRMPTCGTIFQMDP
jgi:hypothetical protein